MKYVVSWTFRSFGSAAENIAATKQLLEAYSKWTPPTSATYHQFLGKVDSGGGYAVVETDNPMDLAETTAKFANFCDYQIEPVIDIADAARVAQEGVEFLE